MKKTRLIIVSVTVLLTFLVSCNLPFLSSSSSTAADLNATKSALDATVMALGVQQTVQALQQSSGSAATPDPVVTLAPVATNAPAATNTVAPTITPTTTTAPVDINTFLSTAKVLIYEDVAGTNLPSWVKQAADGLGLKNYTHIGDDIGKFLQLASGTTTYDLIIIAAEQKTVFKGELFDSVINQMDRGASVAIEVWYLDKIINGRVRPLMDRCGVDFYQNWTRSPGFDKNDYALFWIEPTSPIFNKPNTVEPLFRINFYWSGDVGDLMQLTSNSTAHQLAAPISPNYTRDHGVLYSCIDGRMVLQTFSTHDYANTDMIHLWQNYMYNTLQARLDYKATHP